MSKSQPEPDERIAFFSDVHGCPEALESVLKAISGRGISRMIFLGDVLGYGPDPAPCLRRLRAEAEVCVLGNHDAMALDEECDLSQMPARIAVPLELARMELDAEEKLWLRERPLIWNAEGIQASHASLRDPHLFTHVETPGCARLHFSRQTEPVSFFGHTHVPVIYGLDGQGRILKASGAEGETRLTGADRYSIGVGSVGFSRDSDPRACWVEFRRSAPSVIFHRVAFDTNAVSLRMAEMLERVAP
ncbi:MAG: metallophosphoesterase family protein [Verrucomicrobiota bacterium]